MSTQLDLERASDALWQLRPGEARRLPASSSSKLAEGQPSASFELLEAPHA